jgi:SAM-dependent methyltransferase
VSEDSLTAQEAEFEAIVARLRQEVERGEADFEGAPGERYPARRREAALLWAVSAERSFLSRPGPLGRARGIVLTPVKSVLRKMMRWYVEPFAAEQRRFNAAVLRLVDALSERVEAGAPALLAPALMPDYFAFESRMRGSTESIRDRQRPYVDDFREAAPVLDVGCGRGEFLVLLREAGIEGRGVDLDADMVAYARGEGLEVELADAVEHLQGLEDGSLGGIFAAQLVEHLPAPTLVRLLELAAVKLRPAGVLVAETINPLSPLALRNYYADLTHAQPLVPETLELLARQAGFGSVEMRYLNAPKERLVEPDDPVIAANVSRLNELLFGPLDYAIVART